MERTFSPRPGHHLGLGFRGFLTLVCSSSKLKVAILVPYYSYGSLNTEVPILVAKELKTIENPLQPLSTYITFASYVVGDFFEQPCKIQRSKTLRRKVAGNSRPSPKP